MALTELELDINQSDHGSRIEKCYFTSPLKIGTPNVSDDRLKIVLMMASAGILKGDSFSYAIRCKADTKALITEQSYTKIFKTGESTVEKIQKISVEEQASLFYFPCAVIPFSNSSFSSRLDVHLKESSEFLYTDIVAAGRVGMGEKFKFIKFQSRVGVYIEHTPVWIDHCLLEPQKMNMQSMTFFDEYSHQGVLYYYGSEEKQEQILAYSKEEPLLSYGVSRARTGVCMRILAHAAQDIEEVFEEIKEIIE